MADNQEAPSTAWCLQHLQEGQAFRAAQTVRDLIGSHNFLDARRNSTWRAAAMLRDIEALLLDLPRFSFDPESLPPSLQTYRTFQQGLRQALSEAQASAAAAAGTRPPTGVYGPWQGGRLAQEQATSYATVSSAAHLRVAALNLRGGLGAHGGIKHRQGRLLALVAQLQSEHIHIAVLSEPRLGPGFTWPANLGYTFLGERSTLPDTVAVIIDDRCLSAVSQVAEVGNNRALWLSVSAPDGGAPLLVLAAYGLHKLKAPLARISFWQDRMQEAQWLRKQALFRRSAILLAGDVNAHLPGLAASNQQYCGQTERAIHRIISDRACFGLCICNPSGAPTLEAGTALDVIAASPNLRVQVTVQPAEQKTVPSDHLHLFATVDVQVPVQSKQQDFIVQWARNADWGHAAQPVLPALLFVGAWAALASRWAVIREKLRRDQWVGVRQWLVDIAAWWRAVIFTLAGHVAGLVLFRKPGPGPRKQQRSPEDWLHDATTLNMSSVELRIQEESRLANYVYDKGRRLIARHARLWNLDRSLADKLLSATLKPKQGIVLALRDSDGRELSQARAISVLTQDLVNRAAGKGQGTLAMNSMVDSEVRAARSEALVEAASQTQDPFTWQEISNAMKNLGPAKASVRLPRACAHIDAYPVTLLTWGLCCLIAVTCKLPSMWIREVCPVDKTGSGLIRLTKQVRPITCVDDIEAILDTIWLGHVRPELERFMGFQQSGGRFDHMTVVLGVVLLLQARKSQQLPSLLQIADLEQGYESVWRQALRCLTRRAGIKGWHWLLLDAWLGKETLRVRVGGAIGFAVSLIQHSIGQGKVSGTHLFGTFATALTSAWESCCSGLAVTVNPAANLARHLCVHLSNEVRPEASLLANQQVRDWVRQLSPLPDSEQLQVLEGTSLFRFPYQQYVDDGIIPALDAPALAKANCTLTEACMSWRHKFAGGKKGPRVLPVHTQPPSSDACGTLCGEIVEVCDHVKLLGVHLESDLSMNMQLQHSAAVMRGEGCKLASGMSTAGFGMPATAAQFSLRIVSKALAGSEVLASYQGGFKRAAEQINQAQYVVAKAFLGIPASASVGSRAAVFAETRLLIRAGTMIAQRIAMARARISLLPVHHPTSLAVQCIQLGHVQDTWWQHSQLVVSEHLQVPEIWHTVQITDEMRNSAAGRKRALASYKRQHVLPQVRALEATWLQAQLQGVLTEAILPYSTISPALTPWKANERWVYWPPSRWHLHRIWCTARVTGALPLLTPDSNFLRLVPFCPFCRAQAAGIFHLTVECPAMEDLRGPFQSASGGHNLFAEAMKPGGLTESHAIAKVHLVGGAVARLAQALHMETV